MVSIVIEWGHMFNPSSNCKVLITVIRLLRGPRGDIWSNGWGTPFFLGQTGPHIPHPVSVYLFFLQSNCQPISVCLVPRIVPFQSLFWPGTNVNSIDTNHASRKLLTGGEIYSPPQSNSVLSYRRDVTCSLVQWKHANKVNERINKQVVR